MKTLSIVVLGVALAACVTVGNAQPVGDRGMRAGRGERVREMLNLSEETADKIEKLREEHRKNQIALRAKLDAARVEFHSLMRKDSPDEQLAMAKQKEMSAIRGELQAAGLAHRFAVGKLLTPEQRKIWRERAGERLGIGDQGCRGCGGDDDRPMKHRRESRHHRMEGRGRR